MANEEYLAKLKEGVSVWLEWRENHPDTRPDLNGADLGWTDLRQALLRDADLPEAHLNGADLQRAKLEEANLRGADLREVKGLTKEQIESASIDDGTKLPDGLGPSK